MIRICKGLVKLNTLVGVLAIVLGLASMPQVSGGTPKGDACMDEGATCSAIFIPCVGCEVSNSCGALCNCNVKYSFNCTGTVIGCSTTGCISRI
jgi:hypothetical protein